MLTKNELKGLVSWSQHYILNWIMKKIRNRSMSIKGLAAISCLISICLVACNAETSQSDNANSKNAPKIKPSMKITDNLIKEVITVDQPIEKAAEDSHAQPNLEKITLGAGCFWCVEAVFQRIKGIEKWSSGYMGGKTKNPTYEEICTGLTGHAEVVQLEFDPKVISLEQVLDVFWRAHDPTTLNRQGADIGTQYRSAIFYHSEEQKLIAEKSIKKVEGEKLWPKPIVTKITKASEYYPAEDYHQNYFNLNPARGYCQAVIWPKLVKLGLPFKKEEE